MTGKLLRNDTFRDSLCTWAICGRDCQFVSSPYHLCVFDSAIQYWEGISRHYEAVEL
jgi:hypothetical protein